MHKLIVALDVPKIEEAAAICDELKGLPISYKIGLELTTAAGVPGALVIFPEKNSVMLDLKLYDIPNTMVGAIAALKSWSQVWGVTFHASRGQLAIERILEASAIAKVIPIAVTVLTTFDDHESLAVFRDPPDVAAARFLGFLDAALDKTGGKAGVVCSPLEVADLRKQPSNASQMCFITPGVRPSWAQLRSDDQVRIMSPKEAIAAGADHIVVGRPITTPPGGLTRRQAAERILAEIA